MLNLRIAIALQIARNSIGGTRVGVRQIRHDNALCAESQICSHTVKGVGSFGAAVELDEHTAMVLAAALQAFSRR